MSNIKIRKMKEEVQRYRWSGGQSFGVDPNTAGDELERIKQQNGGYMKSRDVVDASRPESAPLHPAFEWDDWRAAENYRRHQASTLIRALVVVAQPEEPQATDHRAYYSTVVSDKPEPVYVGALEVVNSPAMLADSIRRLAGILNQAQRSIEELEQLAASISAEPERMARISLAMRALEAANAAVSALHH
jgi:hypothetical protein